MEAKQSPATSKTIWGIIIALVPDVVNAIEQAEGAGVIPEKYAPLIRTVGLALAFIGRWGARLPLGFSAKW